jgi:hypothetical protein
MDAYVTVYRSLGDAEAAVHVTIEGVVPAVVSDARELCRDIRDDPAMPNLEAYYETSVDELSQLATLLSESEEHPRICSTIATLMDVSWSAKEVWLMLRRMKTAAIIARGRPPPRRKPKKPLADDKEYYIK